MDLPSSHLCCSRASCIWRDDVLFILHQSIDTWLVSTLGLWWRMLLWTVVCKFLCGPVISVLLDAPVGVEFLGRVVTLFNIVLLLFSCSVMSYSLQPHGLQQARLPCPLSSPRACLNSGPLGQWCHPTILSSAIPFSSCRQSFPTSRSFLMSGLFVSGGQSTGASSSVPQMNIQGWYPLGLTGLISLQSKGFSRIFSNTTVWNNQFFGAQPSLWPNSHDYQKN